MKKIIIMKYGGHAFTNKESLDVLAKNIKSFQRKGFGIIIAHGGTPSVNAKLKEKNIQADMIDGVRVSPKEVVDIVQETLLGEDNVNIVKTLNKMEIPALGMGGADANLLICTKFEHKNGVDYGMVGEITKVNTSILKTLINNNIVPVISPIGVDEFGNSYNLNSDFLASKIAIAMDADILVMVTNIDGVRMNVDDPSTRIKTIDEALFEKLLKEGKVAGAMETKIRAGLDFSNSTWRSSYIIDCNKMIDNDLFDKNLHGTKLVYDSEFEIRLASPEDIPQMLTLVKEAFTDYQKHIDYPASPLYETYEDIIKDIENKYVYVGLKNEEIICSVRFKIELPYAKLFRLCVSPKCYNKGYGSKLIAYVEKYSSSKGACYVGLTTNKDNDKLDYLYNKNGYKAVYVSNNRGYPKALFLKNVQREENEADINWFLD